MTNFSKIKIGAYFEAGDEKFKKTSELTYDDMAGIERYIDPFFDKKIGQAAKVTTIDTSAKIAPPPGPIDVSAKVVSTTGETGKSKTKKAKKSTKKTKK
jgi:hypothetical protein